MGSATTTATRNDGASVAADAADVGAARRTVAPSGWVDGHSMAVARIAFGLLAAALTMRFVARGWVDSLLVAPRFHFTYPGLWWVRPLPAAAMHTIAGVMVLAGLAIAAGWRTRWAAVVFGLGFAYFEAIDTAAYLNHYELVTILCVVMAIGAPASCWSLDAWAGRVRPVGFVPRWSLWLLRFQLGIVYVFAAIGKVNADWVVRGEPLVIWLRHRDLTRPLGPLGWVMNQLDPTALARGLSWAGLAFDLLVVPALLWRRTRTWAAVAAIAFHVMTTRLFPGIGMFPYLMIAMLPIWWPPDWPQRARAWLTTRLGAGAASDTANPPEMPPDRSPLPRSARWALMGWCALQVMVPLRHLAYPGDVRWTEEAYRWSWRVLLTEKSGVVRFYVTDPTTGTTETVYPADELGDFQMRWLATRPEMIRQYAWHLADAAEASGRPRPQVRADAIVSMNGSRPARLIDPAVDLASTPASIAPATWICEPDRCA